MDQNTEQPAAPATPEAIGPMDAMPAGKPEDDGWSWAIVEIFGHRRHVGRVREEEKFGAKLCRIDEPMFILKRGEGNAFPTKPFDPQLDRWETHYYGGSSIFSFTPTSEETAMKIRKREATIEPPAQYQLTDQDNSGHLVLERDNDERADGADDGDGY